MAKPPRSMALNELRAPETLPMGVRAPEMMTEPGMVAPPVSTAMSSLGEQPRSLKGDACSGGKTWRPGYRPAMPTMGLLSLMAPAEPENVASPKAKMPPSEATSQ